MSARLALTLALCLAAPLALAENTTPVEVQPVMPDIEPTKMGTLSATMDGETEEFAIFDYSVGAFDAAAQFRRDLDCSGSGACKETGKIALHLGANYNGDPDGKEGTLHLTALFPRLPKSGGKSREVSLEATTTDSDTPVAVSEGKGLLKITSYRRGGENGSAYGHIKGSFKASLCFGEGGQCHPIEGSFDTDVQFDLPE